MERETLSNFLERKNQTQIILMATVQTGDDLCTIPSNAEWYWSFKYKPQETKLYWFSRIDKERMFLK